jgi:hypothetical protein
VFEVVGWVPVIEWVHAFPGGSFERDCKVFMTLNDEIKDSIVLFYVYQVWYDPVLHRDRAQPGP